MTGNEGADFAGAVDDEGGRPREVEGAGGRRRRGGLSVVEYGGGALLRIAGSVTAAGLEMTLDDGAGVDGR